MKKAKEYAEAIESLRYYASDRRRSKEFRRVVSMACDVLTDAVFDLKECQEIIEEYTSASKAVMEASMKMKRYLDGKG